MGHCGTERRGWRMSSARWLALLAVVACGRPGERPTLPRSEPSAAGSAGSGEDVGASRDRLSPAACEGCHPGGEGPAPRIRADGPRERLGPPHAGLQATHGGVACRACHLAPSFPGWSGDRATGLEALSGGCQPCHGRVTTAWVRGWHGRARGSWDVARGRVRDACVTCHDPHTPVPARRPPRVRENPKEKERHDDIPD